LATLHDPWQSLKRKMADASAATQAALESYLPSPDGPAGAIGQAARFALAGGKGVRPFIVTLAADTFGLSPSDVTPTACAFELIHTATLIHDDLPAIDNADWRRGRPSCHKAFDEPTAILVGDALIVAAFHALSAQAQVPATPPSVVVKVVDEFAHAVQAVVAGEYVDIVAQTKPPSASLLDFIHRHKTAALIVAAARAGAILAGASSQGLKTIEDYAQAIGLLFQVTDDLLDVEGTTEEVGKPVGADARAGKQTYPAVYGVDDTRRRAQQLADHARQSAMLLPAHRELWVQLVDFILHRRS
jgi:geranylgeranyl diphosphate synthase type II